MNYGIVTKDENVAKRKPRTATPSPEPEFDRVEFQAPPAWVVQMDAAAKALGLHRSAYIRMAVSRQMDADRREREGNS